MDDVLMDFDRSFVILQIFDQVTMEQLIEKQRLLTGYLELLVSRRLPEATQMTPADPEQRGCQLSFRFPDVRGIHGEIRRRGVEVSDWQAC